MWPEYTYRIREKFRGQIVSRFLHFYSYSESFITKYLYIIQVFLAKANILTRTVSVHTTTKLFALETFHVYGISFYSARYIKNGVESANDELKGDESLEKKDEEENTVDAGDDVKSKEIVGEDTASDFNKADDDDGVVKEKGAEVHKRGSKNQHFWEIWRRYSEFELLKNFLQTVYPHVSLCT